MTRSRLTGLSVVVGVALIVATAGAIAGAPAAGAIAGTATAGATTDDPAAQLDEPAENSTAVPHERPDSVARSGDASALEARLAERLTDRLTRSAVRIDEGAYEVAQRPVTDGYEAELTLYLEVYRRAVSDDLRQVEQREALFAETAALQVRYAQTLAEAQRVRDEYEAAREAGDRDRARQRARDLNNLTRELRRIDDSLGVRYGNLSGTTPGSLDTASASISDVTEDTTRQTETVVQEAYTPTELTAQADSSGSFTDPIRVTGELAATGDPAPNGNVTFLVNGQRRFVSVDPDGSFALRYRPVTEPVGPASIDVAYVPDDAALYLGSSTDVTTTIARDTPRVSIRDAADTARTASPVTASGRVTADGTPVPNASVELYVEGRRLATTRTDADGGYAFEVPLPVNITTGTRTLSVRAGADDAAVGPAAEATELTVEETATRVSLSAVRSEESVAVSGRLVTEDETSLPGQEISMSLDGERRQTVQTDADGNYETVVALPQSTNASSSLPIRAEFDGSGTSLSGSSVSGSLSPPGQGPLPDETAPTAAVVAGLLLLFAVAFGLYRYRSRGGDEDDPQGGATPPDSIAPEDASPFVVGDAETTESSRPLDMATQYLEHDDARAAVLALYAAVSDEIEGDDGGAVSHWNAFESTADRLSDDQRSTFRDLTEAFEAVRFAGDDPDPERVKALTTEARRLFAEPGGDGFADADRTEDLDD